MNAHEVMPARCLSRTRAVSTAVTNKLNTIATAIGRISQTGCDATDAPRNKIVATGVATGKMAIGGAGIARLVTIGVTG